METKLAILSRLLDSNLDIGLKHQEKRNKAEEETLKYCKIVSLSIQIELNKCVDLEFIIKQNREHKEKQRKDLIESRARSKSRAASKSISKTPTESNLNATRKSRDKVTNSILLNLDDSAFVRKMDNSRNAKLFMTLNHNREKTPDRLQKGLKEINKFVKHKANDSQRSIDLLKSRQLSKSRDKSNTINVNSERLSNDFSKNKSKDRIDEHFTNNSNKKQSKSPLNIGSNIKYSKVKRNNIRAVFSKTKHENFPSSQDWDTINSPKFSNKLIIDGLAKRTSIDYLNIDGDPKIEDITMSRIDNNQTIDNIEKERKLEKKVLLPSEDDKRLMRLDLIKQYSLDFLTRKELINLSLTSRSLFKECYDFISRQLQKKKSERERKLKRLKEVLFII